MKGRKPQDDYFAGGFNFYMVGLMANDTDYTFEKIGEEEVVKMAEYKMDNAKAIKQRRIELKFEEPEGAPSDEEEIDDEAQEETRTIPTSKAQASNKDAPSDGASISPLQSLDASQAIPPPPQDAP